MRAKAYQRTPGFTFSCHMIRIGTCVAEWRNLFTASSIISLSPVSLADRRDYRDTRGKWPLTRNPDRSWWYPHSLKLHEQQIHETGRATRTETIFLDDDWSVWMQWKFCFQNNYLIGPMLLILREKFSPGPGFETRSPAIRAGGLPTASPRRINWPSQNFSLVGPHYQENSSSLAQSGWNSRYRASAYSWKPDFESFSRRGFFSWNQQCMNVISRVSFYLRWKHARSTYDVVNVGNGKVI